MKSEGNEMKKVVLLFCLILLTSARLLSLEITLINKAILSGIFIKQADNKVYLSINEDLYIIDNQVIESKLNKELTNNNALHKINYNSFSDVYNITQINIWNLELFNNCDTKSISINDEIIPFDYNNKIKIINLNNEILLGRYLGESDQNIYIVVDSLYQIPKNEIVEIWLISKNDKVSKLAGSIIGGLTGISLGLLIAKGKIVDIKDKKDSEVTLMAMISTVTGYGAGYLLGNGSGSLFEKEKLVWSKN
jgi:hypothetical protein